MVCERFLGHGTISYSLISFVCSVEWHCQLLFDDEAYNNIVRIEAGTLATVYLVLHLYPFLVRRNIPTRP